MQIVLLNGRAPTERMPPASGEFHDRLWLDPEVHDPKLLEPLLRPYPSEELVVHPVTNLVNNPRNENPGCVEPLT